MRDVLRKLEKCNKNAESCKTLSSEDRNSPGYRGLGAQGLCLERRARDFSGKSFISMYQKH